MTSQHGLDRIATFADAVVAIAITLLVLPLVDLATQSATVPIGRVLGDNAGALGAFALSFAVIARLWMAHRRLFERVAADDSMVVRLTLVWLFTVVFLPFPTELLVAQSGRGPSMLYVGTLLASSVALAANAAWVGTHPALRRPTGTSDDSPWTTTGLLAVAFPLTALVPSASVWPLLFLLLAAPIDALRRRRTGRD